MQRDAPDEDSEGDLHFICDEDDFLLGVAKAKHLEDSGMEENEQSNEHANQSHGLGNQG